MGAHRRSAILRTRGHPARGLGRCRGQRAPVVPESIAPSRHDAEGVELNTGRDRRHSRIGRMLGSRAPRMRAGHRMQLRSAGGLGIVRSSDHQPWGTAPRASSARLQAWSRRPPAKGGEQGRGGGRGSLGRRGDEGGAAASTTTIGSRQRHSVRKTGFCPPRRSRRPNDSGEDGKLDTNKERERQSEEGKRIAAKRCFRRSRAFQLVEPSCELELLGKSRGQ